MKKNIKGTVTSYFLLVCLFLSVGIVKADVPTILIQLTIGSKSAMVNGKEIALDVPPMVINGRTLVPLRFIGEALGSTVVYDAPTKSIKITAPDATALEKNLQDLEIEIASLKKQLENTPGGIQSETDSPGIIVNNMTDNQVITKATILDLTINDKSPIAFVRTKLGTMLLSENLKNFGTIDPAKLVSGNYTLLIEAWDAFGNRGEKKITVTLQNTETVEPVLLKAEAKKMTRQGPPGGGEQPPEQPGDTQTTSAALSVTIENKSVSTLEITKIEVFDSTGNLKQPRSDGGVIDMLKRQSGMNHILLISTDTFTLQAATSTVEEGKQITDVFKGWKIAITFYDSTMQKEIIKTITLS